ncbi:MULTISPECIES: hypothetical protein [unclassified Aeromicrobium]|jgi:hypothetical protein|uniref:hypothetical protein n=1 Tax=unclassified Aeromicrobium TaxID=2633570 RepID=UPI000B261C3D|nr:MULTISPECIES: hypothetical protein [unclassified Aeromicrobium]
MALFGRRRGSSDRRATRDDMATLRAWAGERDGVEAYVEPRTSFNEPTVVLVASDGESIRRRVESPKAAADLARKLAIPVYDANRVGYPQRMRDYAVRKQARDTGRARSSAPGPRRSTPGGSTAPAPSGPRPLSPRERDAIATLQVSADVTGDATVRPDDEVLRRWWKQARARSHPDRRGGDRSEWDEVEQAARTLGLAGD